MARYEEVKTKKDQTCNHCGGTIKKGSVVIYYPKSKKIFCKGTHVVEHAAGTELYYLSRMDSHLLQMKMDINKLVEDGVVPEGGDHDV